MPKRKAPVNAWTKLVAKTKKENPNLKFSEVLKKAKSIYRKK